MSRPRLRSIAILLAVVLILAAVGGYAARSSILRSIGHQLVHADRLVESDAIVVLGGGTLDRELEAAELYQRRLAPVVLITREPEAPVIETLQARGVRIESGLQLRRRVLEDLGVPPDSIQVLDGVVESTRAEAEAALAWSQKAGASRLIVVTSSFHTARSRRVFAGVLDPAGVAVLVAPASTSAFDPDSWWTSRTTLRDGLIEWQKTLYYRVRY